MKKSLILFSSSIMTSTALLCSASCEDQVAVKNFTEKLEYGKDFIFEIDEDQSVLDKEYQEMLKLIKQGTIKDKNGSVITEKNAPKNSQKSSFTADYLFVRNLLKPVFKDKKLNDKYLISLESLSDENFADKTYKMHIKIKSKELNKSFINSKNIWKSETLFYSIERHKHITLVSSNKDKDIISAYPFILDDFGIYG